MNDIINKLQKLTLYNCDVISFPLLSYEDKLMILEWRNSDAIRKWMYQNKIIKLDEHLKFIESLKNSKDKFYWLVKCGNKSIGVINLIRIDWNNKNAFLGIYVNPEEIGKGYGTKLMKILIEITFNVLKFHTLKLEVVEDNIPAIKLYEKLGFKHEGKLKEFVFRDGKWKDMLIMGIINKNN